MAFKGKTTAGYKSSTGKQLRRAKTGGKVGHNPNKGILPGGKSNVVTKATRTGSNPRNSRTLSLNANRIQRVGLGNGAIKQNQPAAKIITPRGKQNFSNNPFKGYNLLANSRSVPAGKGNVRNAGTVNTGSVARIRAAGAMKLPKGALSGGGSFGKFIGK